MRILTVTKHLGPGGIQRAAQNYVRGYRSNGHDVACLCLEEGGSRAVALQEEDIPVFVGGASDNTRSASIETACAWNPRVVHIHRAGPSDPVMSPAVRQLRDQLGPDTAFLETNSFGKVDYSTRQDFVDLHLMKARWALWKWQQWARHYRSETVGTVIPNTVDTDAFYPVSREDQLKFRRKYDIPSDAFLFGRVGQPIRCKWSTVIFAAFQNFAREHPAAHLLVVGLPEELQEGIDDMPASISNRIVQIPFLHSDAELRSCYSAMDVFLHASDIGESFGTVLAESMVCETPVITLSTPTRDNSQLEVVGHNRGGLTVADQQHMEEAMSTLMMEDGLREHLSRQGAKWVHSNYDLPVVLDDLESVIQLAVNSDSAAELRSAIAASENLPTQIAKSEIERLLDEVSGPTRLRQRLMMRLVHVPVLHRLWWKFKS